MNQFVSRRTFPMVGLPFRKQGRLQDLLRGSGEAIGAMSDSPEDGAGVAEQGTCSFC